LTASRQVASQGRGIHRKHSPATTGYRDSRRVAWGGRMPPCIATHRLATTSANCGRAVVIWVTAKRQVMHHQQVHEENQVWVKSLLC
jgi:hypothetical protein